MTDTMFLLVIKQTGHVLAAYSELPDGANPELEDVCGADFMVGSVRDEATQGLPLAVPVARDQLELRSAALDAAVMANPRGFVADGSTTTPIVSPAPNPAPVLTAATISSGSFIDKSIVALNLSGDTAAERRLGMAPAVLPFTTITLKTSPAAGVAAPISAGGEQYDVLIAIPGLPLVLAEVVAP